MPTREPVQGESVFSAIDYFNAARDHASPQERLMRLRYQAQRWREEMLATEPVPYYRSFDLIRVPYPTRYALRDACAVPTPRRNCCKIACPCYLRTKANTSSKS